MVSRVEPGFVYEIGFLWGAELEEVNLRDAELGGNMQGVKQGSGDNCPFPGAGGKQSLTPRYLATFCSGNKSETVRTACKGPDFPRVISHPCCSALPGVNMLLISLS